MDISGRLPWYKSDGFIYGTVGATAGLAVIVVVLLVIWQCCSANRTVAVAAPAVGGSNYVLPADFAEQVLRQRSRAMSSISVGRRSVGGLYLPPRHLSMAASASGFMLGPQLMGPQQYPPYGAPPMAPPNMWTFQGQGQDQGSQDRAW